MANFIQQLQAEVKAKDATIAAAQQSVTDFITFLNGPKFTGTENGERKDWIATGDVIAWLQNQRTTLITE